MENRFSKLEESLAIVEGSSNIEFLRQAVGGLVGAALSLFTLGK